MTNITARPTPVAGVAGSSSPEALAGVLRPDRERHRLSIVTCCFKNFEHRKARWALEAKHLMWLLEPPEPDHVRPKMRRVGTSAQEFAFRREELQGSPLFQQRHRLMRAAIAEQRRAVADLIAPLEPHGVGWPEFLGFLEGRADGCSDLWSYFNHLHRDWSWGGEENDRALQAILDLLPPSFSPRRLLVPGAGACRLAYDVHRVLHPAATFATDIQPLQFLCAAEIIRGKTVVLYEFPPYPLDLASCAVRRELRAPGGPANDNFHLLLTDFNDGCFRPAAFDCIVTHWFIDAVPVDMHRLFALLNQLLCPGGIWINVGPTMFGSTFGEPASRIYSVDEVIEAVPLAGFELGKTFQCCIPYLASPACASQRTERIIGFRATKTAAAAVPDPVAAATVPIPAWLADPSQPVDLGTAVGDFVTAHEVTAEILRAAERRLSVREIVECVSARFTLSEDVAKAHAEQTLRALVGLARH